MSIIGKNLGNAKKHNGKILEHNRLRPTAKTFGIGCSIQLMQCEELHNRKTITLNRFSVVFALHKFGSRDLAM